MRSTFLVVVLLLGLLSLALSYDAKFKPIVDIVNNDIANDSRDQKEFSDMILENVVGLIFESVKNRIGKLGLLGKSIPLKDDLHLKNKNVLMDIDLNANQMTIQGLQDLKLKKFRVARHFGLKDIKVYFRLGCDLEIQGNYDLKGNAMGFIETSGNGQFIISIKGFSISGITSLFLNSKTNQSTKRLSIEDLKLTVNYENVSFKFENLMGGKIMGSLAHTIINSIGNKIVDTQKEKIITIIQQKFRQEVTRFIHSI